MYTPTRFASPPLCVTPTTSTSSEESALSLSLDGKVCVCVCVRLCVCLYMRWGGRQCQCRVRSKLRDRTWSTWTTHTLAAASGIKISFKVKNEFFTHSLTTQKAQKINKKDSNFFASPGKPRTPSSIWSRDDVKHLQTLNTFRHQIPGLSWGRRRRHGQHPTRAHTPISQIPRMMMIISQDHLFPRSVHPPQRQP